MQEITADTTGHGGQVMRDREYQDEDDRREAIMERRARFSGCKCGHPDMPGQCPGWRNCPMHGEPTEARDKQ